MIIDRLALAHKHLAVDSEQICPLHALLARNRPNEQRPIDVLESDAQIRRLHDFGEQRKCTVIKLHGDAFKGGHTGLDLDQVQRDRLVGTKHVTRRDTKEQRVTNVARSTGDGDADRSLLGGKGIH